MNITEEETFVKENYTLSRERVTAYTQLSTEKRVSFKPEFIFKRKRKNINLSPPESVHTQRSEKASYCANNMIETILHLLKRNTNPFTHQNYVIYVLDDYSVYN